MVDSTTTNLDYGTNGFYLPMDGNSPIGEDKSGKGNDFTPQGFGGSVTLDNPNVSGARPVLNTIQGGTQVTRIVLCLERIGLIQLQHGGKFILMGQ